jgi:hypothetical protein
MLRKYISKVAEVAVDVVDVVIAFCIWKRPFCPWIARAVTMFEMAQIVCG